ncbi:cohesin domain-containing protein [Paenibacillus thermoaerophilus]|uniref:Cohesin domain-containing protein n=1 Tax=Paenibacillus thermoaerophilus TaxID=1215385 RepID=A0ABW2V4Y9_9BACL|nr:cohesin domain-containing protein [Paenibacillus thermoaerophilus]TMV18397.1 hypothetical protein FE781_02975 [Paenibacillus thermoaerophilus]
MNLNRLSKRLTRTISGAVLAAAIWLPAESADARIMKELGEPAALGEPIQQAALFDGVYGTENGQDMLYTTSAGNPAMFNAVNLDTYTLARALPLPVGKSAWAHVTAPDGSVYIGVSDGGPILLRYNPASGTIDNLGAAVSGAKSVWSLTADEHGNIYGGTFDDGKVFQYNPATNQFRDYGVMVEGRDYVRSIAYKDGYVYAGIGAVGDLVKLNVETGEKTVIPLKPIEGVTQYPFVYGLDVRGDYLFAFLSGDGKAIYIIYDLDNETWLDQEYWGVSGLRVSPERNNKVYFVQNRELMEWDMTTRTAEPTGMTYGSSLRNSGWVRLDNDPQMPNPVLVTVQYAGGTAYFDVDARKVTTKPAVVRGSSLGIQALEKGPNGVLYMSGYTAATGAAYDPSTGQFSTFPLGQAESIGSSGNTVYFGVYPGAEIRAYDTGKPLKPDMPDQNPTLLFKVEDEQDRPYVNTFGDGKAFFGTIPTYGKTGGALVVFDESDPAGTYKVYRNVVQDQSIVGLAYRDGLIYGSTSIRGGLDSVSPATKAKMFIWDVEKEEKILEWEPDIPGAAKAPIMISGLTFGPDGLLWAAADGILFAIDPDSREITKSKVIFPGVENYGMWRPIHIRFSDDGLLYTDIYGKLVVVDPQSLEFANLGVSAALFTIGDDGNLYYAQEGTLYERSVSDAEYASPGRLSLEAPSKAAPGETFEVKVRVADAYRLYAADVSLEFDPAKVRLTDIRAGDAFAADAFADSRTDHAAGTARAVVTKLGDQEINGNAHVFTFVFQALDVKGPASVTLKRGSALGAVHTAESGLLYAEAEDRSIAVNLRDLTDVNGDGRVDEIDLVAVAKRVGASSFDPDLDVNGDGTIDITDAALVAMDLFE